jgi:DNA-binding transcriptional regulator YiaG
VTPAELRTTRESLGLTQGGAARLLGVDGRTWRYWEAGERGIPEPVARLMRLLERHPRLQAELSSMLASC